MTAVGDALPDFVVDAVDALVMRDWAVFLADPNPIHLDLAVVKAKGLGDRLINQGPINVAYLINMLMRAFPTGTIERIDTRFLDNVYCGDRVVASGIVTAIDGDRVDCAITLTVEDRQVNAGTATILIR